MAPSANAVLPVGFSAPRALAALLVGLVVGLGAGCIPSPDERMPLAIRRASQDLACDESKLTGRYLGDRVFRVSGCGRRATYRVICKLTVYTCYLVGGPDVEPPGNPVAPGSR